MDRPAEVNRFQHAGISNALLLNLAENHLEVLLRALRFSAALHGNFGDFFGGKHGNSHNGRWQLLLTKNAAA